MSIMSTGQDYMHLRSVPHNFVSSLSISADPRDNLCLRSIRILCVCVCVCGGKVGGGGGGMCVYIKMCVCVYV